MRKIFSLLAFSLFLVFNSYGFSVEDSVAKAEKAFHEEHYQTAINIYESIKSEGYSSEFLFYNLGNAYYKTNNISKAILNYEKCLKINPQNSDALFNIGIARLQQSDKITEIPEFFLLTWYFNFISFFDSNAWAFTSIFVFILILVLVYFYLFTTSRKVKKISLITSIVLVVVFAFTFSSSISMRNNLLSERYAIIMTPSLTVKSTPGASGKDLFVIHEGLKVELEDTFNEWVKIRVSNGNEGWVKLENIEKI